MSAVDAADLTVTPASGDRLARRNAATLAMATALAGANASVLFAIGTIIGHGLSGDIGLATLPTTVFVLGTALSTYPAAFIARSRGRRFAFLLGNLMGVAAGLSAAAAIYIGSFALFCVSGFCAGSYHAVIASYRYAAADTATAGFRPKAIAWVLTGGIVAAVVGPQLVIWTQAASPAHPYIITFLSQAAVAALVILITRQFIDQPLELVHATGVRPFREIAANRRFVIAVATGTVAQLLMNFVMTAAPLAMNLCGHSVTDSTLAIQWHIIGMYAPSFFTGSLITRFGKEPVAAVGLVLLAACGAVHLTGISVAHFWIGLILLGVGWNLAFVSATAMITDCHAPGERALVQGFNDFVIFGTTTIGSLAAGHVLAHAGWMLINAAVIPVVLVGLGLVLAVRRAAPVAAGGAH